AGTVVTISGAGFGTSAGAINVTFAGPDNTALLAAILQSSATSLTVKVPAGTVSGNVIVKIGKNSSVGIPFMMDTQKPKPTLSSIMPARVTVGASPIDLRAIGTNFDSTSFVRLDGLALPTTYVDATLLLATIGVSPAAGIHHITVYT